MIHHCLFQRTKHTAQIALDDFADFSNHGVIVGFGNQAFTWGIALVDVVVEADLVLAFGDPRFRQRRTARTDLVDLSEQIQQDMRRAHGWVRTEVFRAVVDLASGKKDARESLFLDTDPRIGLVVLEHDVVARLVLLDHRVLQQQRLRLRVDDAVFEVGDFAHEDARLARLLLIEIAADAAFEVLGLAHIDERTVFVEIAVHAGLIGQRGEFLFYYFGEVIHASSCGPSPAP